MENLLRYTEVSGILKSLNSVVIFQICALLFLSFTVLFYIKNNFRYEMDPSIPTLKLRFYDFFGHLQFLPRKPKKALNFNVYILQILSGFSALFCKKKLCCFWMGSRPFVLLFKAESVEELLSSTVLLEKAWVYNMLHPWLGTGLLTSKGSKWKSRRKLLTPSFHFDILKNFLAVFNEQSEVFVSLLQKETDKEQTNILPLATLCSLDIICETTLGVHIGAQGNSTSDYVQAVIRASNTVMERMINSKYWMDWIFYRTDIGIQFRKDLSILHDFTLNVIREKKSHLKTTVSENNADHQPIKKERKALLDLLLDHHIKYGDISEEDIREEVDTFVFEGHDTTSTGISWALYLIGLHPDIQKKLHEELDKLFFYDCDRPITTDDLSCMTYLECVLKESQRLYPSVPMFGRQLQGDVKIHGYKIPKGSVLTVLPYVLHRDPDVFPNPEVFDPDRFLPENTYGRHPYAYVPFSAGPRNCIGQRFAIMEEKVVLASVLRKYHITSLEQRDKIPVVADLILRPADELKIKISERKLPQNDSI